MCEFLSAVVHKSRGVLCLPEYTDHHSDLLAHYGIKDDRAVGTQNFVRVEFTPKDGASYADPDAYAIRLDETSRPDWYDKAREFDAAEDLRDIIRGMIVEDDRDILMGGCWIINGGKIGRAVHARIFTMLGKSKVGQVSGSTRISHVRGNASISDVGGNASISDVGGNASISDVWDNASISGVRGNASISDVWDNASISDVGGNVELDAPAKKAVRGAK